MGLLQLGLGGGALDCFSHVRQAPASECVNKELGMDDQENDGQAQEVLQSHLDQPHGL